jgi:type III pantothenate kinase
MIAGLTRELRREAFGDAPVVVIGTGGFARLFERETMFDALIPDLVLLGLERALAMNPGSSKPWTRREASGDP